MIKLEDQIAYAAALWKTPGCQGIFFNAGDRLRVPPDLTPQRRIYMEQTQNQDTKDIETDSHDL